MIPCFELRIGNYVFVDQRMHRITGIDNASSSTAAVSPDAKEEAEKTVKQQPLEHLQPVSLNNAILQQCGFVYHDYFKFWQLVSGTEDNRSEMDIDPDYNLIDYMRKPVVKKVASLHQLQNIYFMLKGKELGFQEKA